MSHRSYLLARGCVIAASIALLLAGAAHADEIYKWVDKDGKTHYSSHKEDAEGASMTTVRPSAPPPSDAKAPPSASAANEEIIHRRAPGTIDLRPATPVAVQKPVARNYYSEAPEDKCILARDLLSGRAGHMDGKPLTPRERDVARNDVSVYCVKK